MKDQPATSAGAQGIGVYPDTLAERIGDAHPFFRQLQPKQQIRLLRIFTDPVCRRRFRHRVNDGIFYPQRILREHFGRNYRQIMETFFVVNDDYKYQGPVTYTKAYQLRPEITETVNEFFRDRITAGRWYIEGRKWRQRKNGILSRDRNGNMAKTNAQIIPSVRVNLDNLQRLYSWLSRTYDAGLQEKQIQPTYTDIYHKLQRLDPMKALERIETVYMPVLEQLIHSANVKPLPAGQLLQVYQETSTGRIQGQGMHLQTMPKEIRTEALRGMGYWQYDAQNCHYTVLSQAAGWYDIPLPEISRYSEKTAATRQQIAKETGADIRQVKAGMLALVYGATPAEGWSISDIFGDQAGEFLKHPTVKAIASEIKAAQKGMTQNATRPRNGSGQLISNAMDKTIPGTASHRSIFAHILQGYEASILNAVLQAYGDQVVLLLHDGWITDAELDPLQVQQTIQKATRFNTRIQVEKLP